MMCQKEGSSVLTDVSLMKDVHNEGGCESVRAGGIWKLNSLAFCSVLLKSKFL